MVLEKPENSIDMLEFIKAYGALSYSAAVRVVKQLARSSVLHHQAGVHHRDLKDENILFNPSNGSCKIIDFGCASVACDRVSSFVGTDEYAPPEFLNANADSSFDADSVIVYSIGCILFKMITASDPFKAGVAFDFQRHVQLSPTLSKEERTLLAALLCPDPSSRASLADLI